MFQRTAALTATILALSSVGGASVALAGGETTTVTVPGPPPPPVTVTTPAPPPQTVTVTTPAPAPAPAPKRHRHHRSKQSSSGGSHSGSSNSGSSNSGSRVSVPQVSETTSVARETASTSEIATVPKGGVQAGGGGTAIAQDAGSTAGVLGVAAGLLLVVTGAGLALRRRVFSV